MAGRLFFFRPSFFLRRPKRSVQQTQRSKNAPPTRIPVSVGAVSPSSSSHANNPTPPDPMIKPFPSPLLSFSQIFESSPPPFLPGTSIALSPPFDAKGGRNDLWRRPGFRIERRREKLAFLRGGKRERRAIIIGREAKNGRVEGREGEGVSFLSWGCGERIGYFTLEHRIFLAVLHGVRRGAGLVGAY